MANWNYYLENQSIYQPIYFQRDGSVFIAPDPRSTEVGVNRIEIKGTKSIASGSWTLDTTETETRLPINCLEMLTLGCVWKAHAFERRDRAVIDDAKNEYLNEKKSAIAKILTE